MTATLVIQIIRGRGLAAKDPNGFSDPFVIVEFGATKAKTKVIKKSLNPDWDEVITFPLPTPVPLSLKLTVWDHDIMRPNDFLGVCYLKLEEILRTRFPGDPNTVTDADRDSAPWFKLLQRNPGSSVTGDIQVRAGVVGDEGLLTSLIGSLSLGALDEVGSTISSAPARRHRGNISKDLDGLLVVDVIGANNLPPIRAVTKTTFDMDPFAVVTLGDRCHRTRTINHNLDPVWNQRVVLPVTVLATSWPVTISVYDADKFTSNDFIGQAEVAVADLRAGRHPDVLTLPLAVSTEHATVLRTPASVAIRAVYRPIAEVRAGIWSSLLAKFDENGDGQISSDELVTLLEALGGPEVEDEALDAAYASRGKPRDADLTTAEALSIIDQLFGVLTSDTVLVGLAKCPSCPAWFKDDADVVPHLEHCLTTAREAAEVETESLMMGGFVTENQSSRKGLTKLVHKLTRGEYSIGADSANIIVVNRDNGQVLEEKIPTFVRLGIRMLYRAGGGSAVETAKVRKMLHSMSVKQGVKYTDPKSVAEIPKFIKYHNLNRDEILDPLDSFKNFNEFFYRKLKPGARTLGSKFPEVAVSAADCRLMAFPTIDAARELWIKGRNFTLAGLLNSESLANRYAGGSLVIFRLAPQDYHRFHHPVDGVVGPTADVAGSYFTVNPMAIRSAVDVYLENKRTVTTIASDHFGTVAFVAIGAMMVGSIVHTTTEGQRVARMDEQGYFAFGGSTIIVLFEPGRIELDADLVANSSRKLETLVRVGMSIGHKAGWQHP
ncbi:phosphatidylserine decarboxylase [Blastocladiella emersonii ATCC 22665]|nr:phosphatidylserine decarboxylase [Blastocladiella emersonii ATCC 22665]